jgi:molecular chaperone GrpE (heat shock protein)
MKQFSASENQLLLQNLMQQANIADRRELSKLVGVAELQIIRLQLGLIHNMSIATLSKIAAGLQISLDKLLATFIPEYQIDTPQTTPEVTETPVTETFWKHEYQRLEAEIERQKNSLNAEFQEQSLQTIESWLLQWPTALAAIDKNPDLPAKKLLLLFQPLKQLLQQWEVESISFVGEKLPYDPQWHTLLRGTAESGEVVEVRYVGYKQRDKLLHKVKVSPINNPSVNPTTENS